jgi:hypothetical protein
VAELELEIKHHDIEDKGMAKRVGLLAASIAVVLAVVTILSHRAHTQAVITKTEVNDQWSYFQSKKLRGHTLDLGIDLIQSLGAESAKAKEVEKRYEKERDRYGEEAKEAKSEAERKQKEVELAEHQALRFDIGEGLLELGMVLCSLYFIAHRNIFPAVGVTSAVVGSAIALTGLFLSH